MIRKLLAAATFALALSPVALAQDAPKFSTKTSTIGQILDSRFRESDAGRRCCSAT